MPKDKSKTRKPHPRKGKVFHPTPKGGRWVTKREHNRLHRNDPNYKNG